MPALQQLLQGKRTENFIINVKMELSMADNLLHIYTDTNEYINIFFFGI